MAAPILQRCPEKRKGEENLCWFDAQDKISNKGLNCAEQYFMQLLQISFKSISFIVEQSWGEIGKIGGWQFLFCNCATNATASLQNQQNFLEGNTSFVRRSAFGLVSTCVHLWWSQH